MEEKETITILNKQTKKLETINIHTGEVVTTEGEISSRFLYTVELSEAIANYISEGNTLKQISEMSGMPALYLMYNWRRTHPDFRKKLQLARKDRASYFEDKLIEVVTEAAGASKDDVAALKLQMDGYNKLAEKGDPETYTPKPQNLLAANAPAMIVINTGINREVIEIEANNEKIRIDTGPEDRLRRVHGESESEEADACSSGSTGHGREEGRLPDIEVSGESSGEKPDRSHDKRVEGDGG